LWIREYKTFYACDHVYLLWLFFFYCFFCLPTDPFCCKNNPSNNFSNKYGLTTTQKFSSLINSGDHLPHCSIIMADCSIEYIFLDKKRILSLRVVNQNMFSSHINHLPAFCRFPFALRWSDSSRITNIPRDLDQSDTVAPSHSSS